MEKYLRLAEDGRTQRRTVADALAVLCALPAFTNTSIVHIRVAPLWQLSGRLIHLIDLEFRADDDFVFIVSLASSVIFWATYPTDAQQHKFEVAILNEATTDSAGNIHLVDGTMLQAAAVVPTNLPYNPTDLDWQIICSLVALRNAEDRCIPRWRDKAPSDLREMIPLHLRMMDCQAISRLEAPPLKVLSAFFAEYYPTIKIPSLQKISDALSAFGVRAPTPRPNRRRRRSSAYLDRDC